MKKNGIKKALAFTMAFTLLAGASSLPANSFFNESSVTVSAAIEEDYGYKPVSGGVEITSYVGKSTNVTIPSKLDGKKVVGIGPKAFSNTKVKTVKIENGPEYIGEHAFLYCNSLNSISIPNSIKTIGKYAFASDRSLTKIALPDSVTKVGESAFSDCISLTDVKLSKNLKVIENNTFYVCDALNTSDLTSKLKYIKIPEGVTTIGDSAFKGVNLDYIYIPKSVTKIGDKAIGYNCYNNKYTDFKSNAHIWGYKGSAAEKYAIPLSLKFGDVVNTEKGNVNGVGGITSTDVSRVAAYIKGIKPLYDVQLKLADINGDGKINVADLSKISNIAKSKD